MSRNRTAAVYVATLPRTSEPVRRRNAERLLARVPEATALRAHNGTEALITFARLGIRVSEAYYDGSGWVNPGKLGHWATFLRFLEHVCRGTTMAIWMEDDVAFRAATWRALMRSLRVPPRPGGVRARALLWRASEFDACVVSPSPKSACTLIERVRRDGIDNPTDIFVETRRLSWRTPVTFKVHRFPSTILTTEPLVHVRGINAAIKSLAASAAR